MLLPTMKALGIKKGRVKLMVFIWTVSVLSWVINLFGEVMKTTDLIYRMKEILYYVHNPDTAL